MKIVLQYYLITKKIYIHNDYCKNHVFQYIKISPSPSTATHAPRRSWIVVRVCVFATSPFYRILKTASYTLHPPPRHPNGNRSHSFRTFCAFNVWIQWHTRERDSQRQAPAAPAAALISMLIPCIKHASHRTRFRTHTHSRFWVQSACARA